VNSALLHATCVAVAGRGVLILGPSGSGKSGLALRLLAWGALLVADDRTEVLRQDGRLVARCPPGLSGKIEARGVGILRAPVVAEAEVVLAVDLGTEEADRLPPRHHVTVLGVTIDLVLGSQSDHFPASVLCYLRHGREA